MKVILHVGAHRCATTTFQDYLRRNSGRLERRGIGFWGPRRTRNGLFSGIQPGPGVATGRDLPRRAAGRVQIQLTRSAGLGVGHLVVSDENMMGSVRMNLRMGALYCGVGERMARFAQVFGARATEVVLSVRALDAFWTSSLGYALARGCAVPPDTLFARLADHPRSWRDVIEDLACAMPNARIRVAPFETFAGRPEALLQAMTGTPGPKQHTRNWLNATLRLPELRKQIGAERAAGLPVGDGRWVPFSPGQCAAMRGRYGEDLEWLAAGGDGLASLLCGPDETKKDARRAGPTLPPNDMTRGRRHDIEDRGMARAR